MRIAIAGKGGVGKTTFSATLARLEARRGMTVLCVDADSNPNLAPAMGIDPEAVSTQSVLPLSLISRKLTGPALTAPVEQVLDTHAVAGPDGVRLVLMGMTTHADEGCLCSSHAIVSALISDVGERADTVAVLDLEASPEHLGRGTARHADVLALVTEPYWRSLETIRRMALIASETTIPRVGVVANKVRSAEESVLVADYCAHHGIELLGEVPWSDSVVEADVRRVPLLDADPAGPAVAAIAKVMEQLHQPPTNGSNGSTRAPGGA